MQKLVILDRTGIRLKICPCYADITIRKEISANATIKWGWHGMSVKGIHPVSGKQVEYSTVVRGGRSYTQPKDQAEGGISQSTGNPKMPSSPTLAGSSSADIVDAVEHLNAAVDIFNKGLHFRIHEDTEQIVVEVINKESGEVIRQIPPEYVLDVLAKIDELLGVFIDERA